MITLRMARKRRNLKQLYIATVLQKSQVWYSKVERGLIMPDDYMKVRISELLSCEVNNIQFGKGLKRASLIEKLKQLSAEDLKTVETIIDNTIERKYEYHV